MDLLNKKQREALTMMQAGKNLFLTGPAGTGKTFLLKKFISEYKLKNGEIISSDISDIIGVTSTTGISSLHLSGSTLHSFLGIGLGKDEVPALIRRIKHFSKIQRWKNLQVLVIDEISMLSSSLFDKLNEIGKIVRHCLKPFGGIQLILSGDFLQLPCIDDDFCFESISWKECVKEIIYLTDIVRQSDTNFQKCLTEVRIGELSQESINLLSTRSDMKLTNSLNILPTKLFAINKEVDRVNAEELKKVSEKSGTLYEYNLEHEFLEKYKNYKWDKYMKNIVVPQKIELALGCQVMLIVNLNIQAGLANGSRGIVTAFDEEGIPEVTFLNKTKVIMNYYEWEIEDNGKSVGKYFQIPLKLGYAFSIHKTQGLTLDYAEIDMKNIFERGQAYVALSRIKKLEGLCLKNFNPSLIIPHPKALEFYQNL